MSHIQVWAPNALSVELVSRDRESFSPPVMLQPSTENYHGQVLPGYWAVESGLSPLRDGDGYWFRITFPDGEIRHRADPYARALNHSESFSIYKDPDIFPWSDFHHSPPPLGKMVIYQLFQGGYVGRGDSDWLSPSGENYHFTWDLTRKGDFVQLRRKLDYIQSLGVNTIELLPINEFNGDNYIGYSPVTFFSVESSYGEIKGDGSSYTDLKAFINDAHGRGISVIADVVFNHLGAVGDSGPLWNYDSTQVNIYFSGEEASNQAGGTFGMAPDWSRPEVQKYVEDACHYYFEELHFDGLRFDFTSQIINKNSNAGANSGAEALRRILQRLKSAFPDRALICEHWDEASSGYNRWMMTHIGFDAGWINFRNELEKVLEPFSTGGEEALAYAINGGSYPHSHSRVIYANNHDECWWDGRPGNERKLYPVSHFGWRGDYWSKKKSRLISALSFFVPGIPLFFMGDEFAMEGSFNDARKENILDWSLEKITPGPEFKLMFLRLIELRQTHNALVQDGTSFEWLHFPSHGWFAFKRKWGASVMIVAGNWTGADVRNRAIPTRGESGNWTQVFNSDGQEFGGSGVGNFNNNPNSDHGSITVNIPSNGLIAMGRTSI